MQFDSLSARQKSLGTSEFRRSADSEGSLTVSTIASFLTRTKGRKRLDLTDVLTYLYLFLGVVIMFGPVLWLVLSSFKTPSALIEFPPSLLPYSQETVTVEGYDSPLPLFERKARGRYDHKTGAGAAHRFGSADGGP